jgi:1-deoxy-D-xylulose-5-phosphate synthase
MAFMNSIPDMVISAPMNEVELRNLMLTASDYFDGPFSIRYPRNRGVLNNWKLPMQKIEIGKGRQIKTGNTIAILSIGHVGNYVTDAIDKLALENIFPSHYDMRFLSPIDEEILHDVFANYTHILTVEDGVLKGGLASNVIAFSNKNNYLKKVFSLGIPHKFIEHGNIVTLQNICGYDTKGIIEKVKHIMS